MDTTSVSLLHKLRLPKNEAAWSRFDDRYRSFIVRFLKSQKLDEHIADDVCQNVMKQVYEVLSSARFEHNGNKGAFRNWLRRVVTTQLALHRRQSARHEQSLPLGLEDDLSKADSRLIQLWNQEHNRAMLDVILDLLREHTPPDSLEIFRRTFVEGVPAEDVAQEFDRTKNAVVVVKCKVLKRARELAADLME